MLAGASQELGMSFEMARTVEVMKEHGLTGLAGANLSNPEAILKDPGLFALLRDNPGARELVLYLGGAKLKGLFESKLSPPGC